MRFDQKRFLDAYREHVVAGDLQQVEVDNLAAILDRVFKDVRMTSTRQLAYMIATARWETRRFLSMREQGGHAYLRQYDGKGGNRPGTNDYYDFRGGGWCHTTFRSNYRQATQWCRTAGIPVDLERNPERILDPDVNYEVMVTGHLTGGFTRFKLSDFVTGELADYRRARLVINPGELYIADGKWNATPKRRQQCREAVDTIVKWAKGCEVALKVAGDAPAAPILNNEPVESFEPKPAPEETVKPQILEAVKAKAGDLAKAGLTGTSLTTVTAWLTQNRWAVAAVMIVIAAIIGLIFRTTIKTALKTVFSKGL